MTAPLVPRQVLFGNPERVSPRISPDGRRLAWIAPDDGVLNVWVNQVGADLGKAEAVTDDRDRGIRSFFWAHDNRHLLYIQDVGGDEDWHLFSVDLETGETQDVTPFEGVQARVDETDKRFPDTILIGLNKDNPQLHDVYRLDLKTGDIEKIVANPGFIGFLADADRALALLAQGGLYAAPDPSGFRAFSGRYRAKYGADPVRTATLAYDAVALVAALSKQQGANIRDRPRHDIVVVSLLVVALAQHQLQSLRAILERRLNHALLELHLRDIERAGLVPQAIGIGVAVAARVEPEAQVH